MKIMSLVFIAAGSLWASANDLPDIRAFDLSVQGCSQNHHVAKASFHISNFSPYNMDLPQGLEWASADEFQQAAEFALNTDFGPELNAATDVELLADTFFQDMTMKAVEEQDTDQNGHVITGKVTLITKVFMDIKRHLIAVGKYSGSALNYQKSGIEVDLSQTCNR